MNKILGYTILWFNTIIKPFIFLILFGEVGIRLYTKQFDGTFWSFLIAGYILSSILIYNFYSGIIIIEEEED